MATYYIDPISGNDSNDGLSEATPCASMDHVVLNLLGAGLSADGTMYVFGTTAAPSPMANTVFAIRLMRGTVLSRGFIVVGDYYPASNYNTTKTLSIAGANNALLLIPTTGVDAFQLDSSSFYTPNVSSTDKAAVVTLQNVRCFANRTNFCRQVGTAYNNGSTYAQISGVLLDNVVIRGCGVLLLHQNIPTYGGAIGGASGILIRNIITDAPPISTDFTTRVPTTVIKSVIGDASKTQEVGSYTYAPTPAAIMAGEGAFLPQPSYVSAVTPGLIVTNYNFSPNTARSFLGSPGVVASAWVDDVSYPHGTANISTSQITIATGSSARVLSPVQVFPEGISFSTTAVSSIEDEGAKDVLDSTPADSTRTIDVRVSDTPFTQLDVSPAWVAIPRNSSHQLLTGKYVQFRITLTTEGA